LSSNVGYYDLMYHFMGLDNILCLTM